jgi:hypothetical protein
MNTNVRGMGKLRRLGAQCVAVTLATACSSTTTTQTVSSPVTELRTMVDPDEPIATSTWALEGSKVTGHVSWASCVSQRSWTTEQQSTVRRRPIPIAGWGLLLGGGALVGVGLGTRDSSAAEPACPTDPVAYNEQMLYGPSCGHSPSNGSSNAEVLVGAIAMVAGLAVLSVSSSAQTQTLGSQPHAETATGPCISPADLATLSLVLKLGERQFVHVALQSNGEAVIELPAHLPSSARLTPGADLPIVVYRAPRSVAGILPRWQLVGTVHVPE